MSRPGVHAAFAAAATTLGQRIRSERERIGWTQEQAAERIGVHPKQVQRMELGRANVTLATLVATSVAYGVPLTALFANAQADQPDGEAAPSPEGPE